MGSMTTPMLKNRSKRDVDISMLSSPNNGYSNNSWLSYGVVVEQVFISYFILRKQIKTQPVCWFISYSYSSHTKVEKWKWDK